MTGRLGEIAVPALVLAGELDQVVPLASTRLVAERIPGATLITDPECGHTVRSSFRGYDDSSSRSWPSGLWSGPPEGGATATWTPHLHGRPTSRRSRRSAARNAGASRRRRPGVPPAIGAHGA